MLAIQFYERFNSIFFQTFSRPETIKFRLRIFPERQTYNDQSVLVERSGFQAYRCLIFQNPFCHVICPVLSNKSDLNEPVPEEESLFNKFIKIGK